MATTNVYIGQTTDRVIVFGASSLKFRYLVSEPNTCISRGNRAVIPVEMPAVPQKAAASCVVARIASSLVRASWSGHELFRWLRPQGGIASVGAGVKYQRTKSSFSRWHSSCELRNLACNSSHAKCTYCSLRPGVDQTNTSRTDCEFMQNSAAVAQAT